MLKDVFDSYAIRAQELQSKLCTYTEHIYLLYPGDLYFELHTSFIWRESKKSIPHIFDARDRMMCQRSLGDRLIDSFAQPSPQKNCYTTSTLLPYETVD